jgi:hypothetical protein
MEPEITRAEPPYLVGSLATSMASEAAPEREDLHERLRRVAHSSDGHMVLALHDGDAGVVDAPG